MKIYIKYLWISWKTGGARFFFMPLFMSGLTWMNRKGWISGDTDIPNFAFKASEKLISTNGIVAMSMVVFIVGCLMFFVLRSFCFNKIERYRLARGFDWISDRLVKICWFCSGYLMSLAVFFPLVDFVEWGLAKSLYCASMALLSLCLSTEIIIFLKKIKHYAARKPVYI